MDIGGLPGLRSRHLDLINIIIIMISVGVNPQNTAILYRGCHAYGHQGQPLDKVCVDIRCNQHGLICSACYEMWHNGHNIVPFAQFLSLIDNMRYQQPGCSTRLKQLKVTYV